MEFREGKTKKQKLELHKLEKDLKKKESKAKTDIYKAVTKDVKKKMKVKKKSKSFHGKGVSLSQFLKK